MSNNLRVAILFGGTSSEHDISLRSATNVLSELDGRGYELALIGITREGTWLNYTGDAADVREGDAWASHDVCPVVVVPGDGLFRHEADGTLCRIAVDVALPVLHGQGGEDGITQALLESAGVPYVGCGVLSSAVCMDKDASHRLAAASGIRVPKCEVLYRGATEADVRAAVEACGGYPVFVKPTRGGSSYGVSKVADASEMAHALEVAFALDPKVSVEEAIEEADFVISLLEGHEIDGPVAYDWEMHDSTYRVYGTTPEMATACAVAFCQRIEEAGYDAMVYAGQYVSYIKYDQGALEPYLSWYPEYKSTSSEQLYPTLYYHRDYWQYSSSGTVDGIGGNVDLNLQFISR